MPDPARLTETIASVRAWWALCVVGKDPKPPFQGGERRRKLHRSACSVGKRAHARHREHVTTIERAYRQLVSLGCALLCLLAPSYVWVSLSHGPALPFPDRAQHAAQHHVSVTASRHHLTSNPKHTRRVEARDVGKAAAAGRWVGASPDAESGTWISTHPLGLGGGTQTYGFDGSPTDVVDPLGLSTKGGNCPSLVEQAARQSTSSRTIQTC
jgi:hypothetical protein